MFGLNIYDVPRSDSGFLRFSLSRRSFNGSSVLAHVLTPHWVVERSLALRSAACFSSFCRPFIPRTCADQALTACISNNTTRTPVGVTILRHGCRPLTRRGPSGPDPVRLFGAAWTSALAAEDAPGDDRHPNHPDATEVSSCLTPSPEMTTNGKKIVPVEGTYLNIHRP
jgi:hypothetical protein